MSVPNQKKIIIERHSDKTRENYLKISNESLNLAMYNLKPSAFMLWIYFTDNSNGYKLDLYPVNFINKTGLSRSTYDRAFEELEEKGYLIKSKSQNNLYLFSEISDFGYIPKKGDEVISLEKASLEEIKRKYFE